MRLVIEQGESICIKFSKVELCANFEGLRCDKPKQVRVPIFCCKNFMSKIFKYNCTQCAQDQLKNRSTSKIVIFTFLLMCQKYPKKNKDKNKCQILKQQPQNESIVSKVGEQARCIGPSQSDFGVHSISVNNEC